MVGRVSDGGRDGNSSGAASGPVCLAHLHEASLWCPCAPKWTADYVFIKTFSLLHRGDTDL